MSLDLPDTHGKAGRRGGGHPGNTPHALLHIRSGRVGVVVSRFEVWLVGLDPTQGSERQKTRPCLVISPDEINRHLATVVAAPMTTKGKPYPWRVRVVFQGKKGLIALDQIRAVDKKRLVKRVGTVDSETSDQVLTTLGEMFAP